MSGFLLFALAAYFKPNFLSSSSTNFAESGT
jgi:hypothetical protein